MRRPQWLRDALIVVLFVGAVIELGMLVMPATRPSFQPAATVEQRSPSPTAADAQKRPECQRLLNRFKSERYPVFSSTERDGEVLRVYVEPAFYFATIQQKQALPRLLRCAENDEIRLIRFLDARSGKRVALWSESTGFSMTD